MQGTNGEPEPAADRAEEQESERPFREHGRMPLRNRMRSKDAYGVLLVLIIASLIASALSGRSRIGEGVAVLMQGVVLLFALWTAEAPRRVAEIAVIAVPLAVAAAAALSGGESDGAAAAVTAVNAVLAAGAITAIVRRIGAHPRVDAVTILGALSSYLLIGTFFAFVFATVSNLIDTPYFVQTTSPNPVDFLYFSFITMTTVGYGDFTAATDLGRMLAVTEALIGQLYLVTVVALVIGNIGRERRRP
jgi:hypothetical protein